MSVPNQNDLAAAAPRLDPESKRTAVMAAAIMTAATVPKWGTGDVKRVVPEIFDAYYQAVEAKLK